MILGQRNWDLDVLADIFNDRDRAIITQIPLSSRREEDIWYWSTDARGIFTVRSCYKTLAYISEPPSSNVWQKV